MAEQVFQDPARPYQAIARDGYTLQIHAPLPARVAVGHYEADRIEPVVDEVMSRADYLDRIQQACAEHGDAYHVRFYRHPDGFDASVLDQLDQIRSLQVDPVGPVAHPEAVGRLPHLVRLGFAPRGKTDPNVLHQMRVQRLEYFLLAETAAPQLDLAPLGEARSLHTLRLLAQGKNVAAIGNCTSLVELSMHPQESHPLEFIGGLPRLEVLKFSLGKRRSIQAIEQAPLLRDLSFNLVSTLENLGDLQRFPRLRRLQIQDQKRLKMLQVGPGNVELEHIVSDHTEEIDGLSSLPALKSLFVFNGGVELDWARLPSTLSHFALMPTALKARERHAAEVRARGLVPEIHPEALFFYK